MAKRAAHPDQLDLLAAIPVATGPGSLAGSGAQTARAVAEILKDDPRAREVIAAEMSVLLTEDVSAHMLNGYSSPARETVNISWDRWKALIIVTGRIDILKRELGAIGVSVIDANGLLLAELGHLDRIDAENKRRRKMLQSLAQPIGGTKSK